MGYNILFKGQSNTDDSSNYFLDKASNSLSYFPNLNNINIIVGANNSGKSMFIRYFMNLENIRGVDVEKINSYYEITKKFPEPAQSRLKEITFDADFENILKHNFEVFERFQHNFSRSLKDDFINLGSDLVKDFSRFKRYYIPTLRTAHSLFKLNDARCQKIENDIFLETLNYYYKLDNRKINVFTGIHLYKEILNTRNSKRDIRQSFEKFEDFIGKYFFDNRKVDIVAEFNKDESLAGNNNLENISVHIEGEKDTRDLFRLGDGIQAIIILMYKIFMAEPESFIFIDEPELNLHPGMQRLFLEQITSNKDLTDKNLKYIITTHSNHLLDLTIEKENVSIYSFSPKNNELNDKQFTIKNVNRGDNSLLKDLGVNNSSVFMANCSIWVEGISDRNYIKAFLKSYSDSIGKSYPKEDIDFAFFEYAGSNIDHYIFEDEIEDEKKEFVIKDIKSLALSNRIFLLADSDAVTKTKNKQKFERLETLKNAESDNFKPKIIWDVREIENLLTNEIWKKVLINFCNEKLVNQYEVEIQNKIELALGRFDANKFKKEYIGNFLNDLREEIRKKGNVYILNKSFYEIKKNGTYGTIIDKRGLSEKVLKADFPWSVFSKNKEIKNLTIEIYDFITKKT